MREEFHNISPSSDDEKIKRGVELFDLLQAELKAMCDSYECPTAKYITYTDRLAQPIRDKFERNGGRAIAEVLVRFKSGEEMTLHFNNQIPREKVPETFGSDLQRARAFEKMYWDYIHEQAQTIKNKALGLENVESAEIRWS